MEINLNKWFTLRWKSEPARVLGMKAAQKSVSGTTLKRGTAMAVFTVFFACLALDIAVPAAVLGFAALAQGLLTGFDADAGAFARNGEGKIA